MKEGEKYYSCFDSPDNYTGRLKFYYEGGSPKILEFIKDYLLKRASKITGIDICLYLFNNIGLHKLFQELAAFGITVNVISIPLEGYDKNKPKHIINEDDGKKAYRKAKSKFDLAVPIYQSFLEKPVENYSLYIFPHMYIRSAKTNTFSRGNLPYSLHIKSILIKFRDGNCAIGITSSNLAVRDIVKEENIIIVEGKDIYNQASIDFFTDLISQSIPIKDFDENLDWKKYELDTLPQPKNRGNFFIAPFYKDSPLMADTFIKNEIRKATERIYISGQHIAAYKYEFPTEYKSNNPGRLIKKDGFLKAVLNKASEGLNVVCLSQTFIDPNGSTLFVTKEGRTVNTRKPANVSKFREFVNQLTKYDNMFYMINEYIHSKYLLIDNTLIVTTCNFTPTQFIYIDEVDIPEFGYKGIFSEVGQFIIIRDKAMVNKYSDNFRDYWNHKNTIRYK